MLGTEFQGKSSTGFQSPLLVESHRTHSVTPVYIVTTLVNYCQPGKLVKDLVQARRQALPGVDQNSRLLEGKQVLRVKHRLYKRLGIVSHSYQEWWEPS